MENKRYKKEQDIHLTKEEYLAQLKKYLKRLGNLWRSSVFLLSPARVKSNRLRS